MPVCQPMQMLLLLHERPFVAAGEVETLAETWMLMEYCDRWGPHGTWQLLCSTVVETGLLLHSKSCIGQMR